MKITHAKFIWMTWLVSSIALGGYLSFDLFKGTDKTTFMPGPLTDGHYQFTQKCEVCHGKDAFGGTKKTGAVLQEACLHCHGDDRKKPNDSHPIKKFEDPRNAKRLKNINAVKCVTCHTEHRPEITLKDGLTQPIDVCFKCHADVAKDRPTHKNMPFNTCKDSGCHNYHNNRALYTKFLVKHYGTPDTLEKPLVPEREFSRRLNEFLDYPRKSYPVKVLTIKDEDAPTAIRVSQKILTDWSETGHARSGVNCTACHMFKKTGDGKNKVAWVNKPDQSFCVTCHNLEVKRFGKGKHGMRIAAGLSPMTPGMARLPMSKKVLENHSSHNALTCNTCHSGHRYDVKTAAVEACLKCHADEHSLAYKKSKHYQLWLAELKDKSKANSGVSCATCHMPRIDFDINEWSSRIMIDHNQNANLSPNSKMTRTACLYCHGLSFSLDSLADKALIQGNFNGKPSKHINSLKMAKEDTERRKKEKGDTDDDDMFGF